MAIANYEDRFVIPTTHREVTEDAYELRGQCGFTFGDGCMPSDTKRQSVRRRQNQERQAQDGSAVMKTLKVLSALLTYPTAELIAARTSYAWSSSRKRFCQAAAQGIADLIDDLASGDLIDAQERYILLFDRTRSLSLHLFEHVHGESRDRGQAMVDLIKVYEDGGYTPTTAELPDFLPLFLEFASTRTPAEAIELIGQPAHVFAALRERLSKRSSPYEAVFAALILGQAKPTRA